MSAEGQKVPFPPRRSRTQAMPLVSSRFQNQFHIDHIEPATELEADLLQMPDLLKVKLRVQRQTGGLLGINAGDDGVMAEPAGADNQFLQQQRADAEPVLLVMHID